MEVRVTRKTVNCSQNDEGGQDKWEGQQDSHKTLSHPLLDFHTWRGWQKWQGLQGWQR